MSEARGRPAQDSAEKQGSASKSEQQAMRSSNATLTAATATALAGTGFAAMGMAKLSERDRDKIARDMRRDQRKFRRAEMASRRRARALDKQMDSDKNTARRLEKSARGGGGGLYVTPDAATGRDVTKRFKKS